MRAHPGGKQALWIVAGNGLTIVLLGILVRSCSQEIRLTSLDSK